MTMAHRIGVMDRGRLAQIATPAELYEQPNSRWVAEFIGDVNLIEGGIVAAPGGGLLVETGAGQRLNVSGGDAKPGARVWLALRPEKVRIAAQPPEGEIGNSLSGRVVDIGYLGDMSVYKVRLDDGSIMRASVANARRVTEREIGWEQEVWLSWPADAAVVLTR